MLREIFFIYRQVRMMASSSLDSSASFSNYSDYGPSWQTVREKSVSLAVFGAVLSFVLSSLSIAGSILLVAVILRFPQLRHVPSNLLLISLGASDLLIGLLAQPLHGLCALSTESCASIVPIPPIFLLYFGSFLFQSSCLNLTMMTVDRYICIVESLRYQTIVTEGKVCLAIFISWSISAVLPVTHLFRSFMVVTIFLQIIFILSVLFIIIFCYARIFCISRRHKRQISEQLQAVTQRTIKQDFKSAKTVFLIIGAVSVSYVPLIMLKLFSAAGITSDYVKMIHPFATAFFLLNSSVNSWRVFFRSRKLSSFPKRLFKCDS